MNKRIGNSDHKWQGEYQPEVGNLASVGNIRRPGCYGTVTEVVGPDTVKVTWYASKKNRRAPAENKSHQAVRRVVSNDTLKAMGL
jgi:hypothetical protein